MIDKIHLKKVFIENYGCQMNFSDSEIVASILSDKGFFITSDYKEADVILLNTCSIRNNAERRVRHRLHDFKKIKKQNPSLIIGILGCMAERLKEQLLEEEKLVDLIAGPDAYRSIHSLIETVEGGQKAVNVLLSREETYSDINPVRLGSNGVSAFISIMRGCDNMCSFCVVPFTRGRERSRNPQSIVKEATGLFKNGYREVTLLGQNVDSYKFNSDFIGTKSKSEKNISFADLLESVAKANPDLRIRFSTSHPKDMIDDILFIMAKHDNICKYIHLPMQSGSTKVLERMNRRYSREEYLQCIESIRKIIPDCGISTDIISGFCGETDSQHRDTLSLMELVKFDFAYTFKYSERPGTLAEKKFKDDISDEVKGKRLKEIIDLQQKHSAERIKNGIGKVHIVLIEGVSKKSADKLYGRNSQNTIVVFPKGNHKKGQYVNVLGKSCTTTTIIGEVV
ncbi:MAG: tRNA (N6-isopentenyl adenosine(37)-C2)-methylthiotransferase MiaB [Bacteroidota bacterium]